MCTPKPISCASNRVTVGWTDQEQGRPVFVTTPPGGPYETGDLEVTNLPAGGAREPSGRGSWPPLPVMAAHPAAEGCAAGAHAGSACGSARAAPTSVLAAVISVPAGALACAPPTHRPANAAPAIVVALARTGLGRTFTARDHLSGQRAPFPGPSWTVTVARRGAAPTRQNWLTSGGQWSFLLHAGGDHRSFVKTPQGGPHETRPPEVTILGRGARAPSGRGS